jgi:Uma2 family endonuclease
MKGVLPNVPEHILAWRARTGEQRWDEMWDGVLHMPPSPTRPHQELESVMETWLRTHWRPAGNKVYHQINVAAPGCWPDNYRIPDLVLLTPDRFGVDQNVYFDGAPTVAVEICSPEDEAYEKLDFYAAIGTPETWIVDPDEQTVEIFALAGGEYHKASPDGEGWLTSPATGVQLRFGGDGKLLMRMSGDPATEGALP